MGLRVRVMVKVRVGRCMVLDVWYKYREPQSERLPNFVSLPGGRKTELERPYFPYVADG